MAQTKGKKAMGPVNRIKPYLSENTSPRNEWASSLSEKKFSDLFASAYDYGDFSQPKTRQEKGRSGKATDWMQLAKMLVERPPLENRIEIAENKLKDLTARLARMEELCERSIQKTVCVPVSTFAPEPFEVTREFSVVIQPEEDGFVAALFDANISSSGDTQEEALANVKDLILMIFQGFEDEDDSELGPAMIRQKHALLSLIRRT